MLSSCESDAVQEEATLAGRGITQMTGRRDRLLPEGPGRSPGSLWPRCLMPH